MNRLLVVLLLLAACRADRDATATAHFPIRGLHQALTCSDCHADGPVQSTCASCHEGARPADHYTGDCAGCHSEDGWGYAVVDHTQYLPLDGGHAPLTCLDCHATDTFAGLDRRCASCHESDRPANHFAGGCEECHSVSGWGDAAVDHDEFFPLPHRGVDECGSCHLQAPDYGSFSCIDCHAHRRSEMDDEHLDEGIPGYRWESESCLNCHPRGRE